MKTLSSKHPGFYYNFTTNDGYDLPPFAKILKNSQKISKFYHLGKSPQNPANLGISGRNLVMIRIMFVCHGSRAETHLLCCCNVANARLV